MASVAGSPDAPHGRSMPPWAAIEVGDNTTEALQALDTYKKKDPSKGLFPLHHYNRWGDALHLISCGTVQGSWKCSDHEAELLQDYRIQSVPSCHPIFEEGVGVESW